MRQPAFEKLDHSSSDNLNVGNDRALHPGGRIGFEQLFQQDACLSRDMGVVEELVEPVLEFVEDSAHSDSIPCLSFHSHPRPVERLVQPEADECVLNSHAGDI